MHLQGVWVPFQDRWLFVLSKDLWHFYTYWQLLPRSNYPSGQRALPQEPSHRKKMDEKDDTWTLDEECQAGMNLPSIDSQTTHAFFDEHWPYIPYNGQPTFRPLPGNQLAFQPGGTTPGALDQGIFGTDEGWTQEGAYRFNNSGGAGAMPWQAANCGFQAMSPPQIMPSFIPSAAGFACSLASEDEYSQNSDHESVSQASEQRPTPTTSPAFDGPSAAVVNTPAAPRKSLPTSHPFQPIRPASQPPRRSSKKATRVAPLSKDVRAQRDRQILEGRQLGLKYNEIRGRYNMPEAESTLRGRHRILTKTPDQRVRMPVWQAQDVQILFDAVQAVSKRGSKGREFKWKHVTGEMEKRGVSYNFSASACRKKWEEEEKG